MEHFKPLTFNDFDIISSFLKKYPSENTEYNICTIFTWELYFKPEYTIYLDRLILFNPFYSYILAPIGENLSAEELFYLCNCCKKTNQDMEIMAVSEDFINKTPNLGDYFFITNDENLNDYIYLTESLVKLNGKKLAKKKNLVSQFKKLYGGFVLKPINKNDYAEIMDFCFYWKKTQKIENEYLDVEFASIKAMLEHWDLFPCDGIKLYANGKICAFSIYSPQTTDMATIHTEKCDPDVKGAGQVINNETAKILEKDFKYINREQDMGSAGIRQAKRSYQPVKMLPHYRLKCR